MTTTPRRTPRREFLPRRCSAGLGMKVLKALVGWRGDELRMASNSSGRGACVAVTWPGEVQRYAIHSQSLFRRGRGVR
jgi:K+-sensing histidine kinase KdpD